MKDVLIKFDDGTIFKNGDLNVGDCDDQNKTLLLINEKGSLKQFPASCVGVATFLEDEDTVGLTRETRQEFVADGMTVTAMNISGAKLEVDAHY